MYKTLRWPGFKVKALTLSYDDGVCYDKRLIEIFDKHGLKGTFNINGGLFGFTPGGRRMTQEECVELYNNSNHEVAIHGYDHMSLGEIDEGRIALDVIKDRDVLEKLFGKIIKGMAYANGSYSDKVVEVLKNCGVDYARTTVTTGNFAMPLDFLRLNPTCHHKNENLMEYADKFLEYKDWARAWPILFYVWGHSYEFNDNDNWEIMENFAEKVGNKDDVYYATNGEIYDYMQAYRRLIYSADGYMVKNPSSIDVYLNVSGEEVLVKAGEVAEIKTHRV